MKSDHLPGISFENKWNRFSSFKPSCIYLLETKSKGFMLWTKRVLEMGMSTLQSEVEFAVYLGRQTHPSFNLASVEHGYNSSEPAATWASVHARTIGLCIQGSRQDCTAHADTHATVASQPFQGILSRLMLTWICVPELQSPLQLQCRHTLGICTLMELH